MPPPATTLILFGGNFPQTIDLFRQAEEYIKSTIGEIINKSSVYISAPYGFEAETDFFNMVVEVRTNLDPDELISNLLNIETRLGRVRNNEKGYISRGIDLDILFIDDLIINTQPLVVPHPRLHLRRFTLVPLNEKWSEKVHPIFNKTISELLHFCKDESAVTQFVTV